MRESEARRVRPALQAIAAGALALILGLGQAGADTLSAPDARAQNGETIQAPAAAAAAASDGAAHTRRSASVDAGITDPQPDFAGAAANQKIPSGISVNVEEEGAGTDDWTRTVTSTETSVRAVTSTTQSTSIAFDDDGNRVVSVAIARAIAPNNAAAVMAGGGKVSAKTNVDVTGNGTGSASADGSIGLSHGVKVSTWGETSAEVF